MIKSSASRKPQLYGHKFAVTSSLFSQFAYTFPVLSSFQMLPLKSNGYYTFCNVQHQKPCILPNKYVSGFHIILITNNDFLPYIEFAGYSF